MEDQVPESHLLRQIDRHITFAFVREKLKESYSDTGRPSIDPELLLRILLIGYLYGIPANANWWRTAHASGMALVYWPRVRSGDSASLYLSKNRHGRFQESKAFEQLFEEIVTRCLEASLVQGDNLSVDGSFIEANASKASRVPGEQLAEAAQVKQTVRQYPHELEKQIPTREPMHEQDQVSTTDPDSTYATKGGTPGAPGLLR